MPIEKMLTDTAIRNAKPKAAPYTLNDGNGLALLIDATRRPGWRLRYTFGGKRKLMSLGTYPAVTLAAAREARDLAQRQIAEGNDPGSVKQKEKSARADTFRATAQEWLTVKVIGENKGAQSLRRQRYLLGVLNAEIGDMPIGAIKPPDVLTVIRPFTIAGKHETARYIRSTASRVFQYGVACGRCERDMAIDLKGALTAPTVTPRAALIEPEAVAKLFRKIVGHDALQFLSLTLARPGEVAAAEWSEISFEAKTWQISAEKMKMRRPHDVPLSKQALAILARLKKTARNRRYIFATDDQPLAGHVLNRALRSMGYDTKAEHSAHGFRATASSLLNGERHNSRPVWHPDVIELQLAHVDKNNVRASYNRAQYWPERVSLMQHWADRIDALRDGGKVVKLARAG